LTITPPGHLPNRISFTESFTDPMLDFMSEKDHMPVSARMDMSLTRRVLRRKGIFVDGKWHDPRFLPNSPEAHLFDLVRGELLRCELAFIRTSTLQDKIAPQDANAIFTLGEYIAYLNIPYIRTELAATP
jgi:hypothetical protein